MSRGNQSIDVSVSQPRSADAGQLDLHTLVRDGRSFSGRERHCCFLNTGGPRFADVSAISNLDYPDDGRAIAACDWDQDGDLDLWFANRNGPQLRFLNNEVPTNHHYLALRLVGTRCNRDAIGARVELIVRGEGNARQLRTVRAGDGYLSQSSKWLHFGLGRATQIDQVAVHWPGGEVETFRGLMVDSQYRLIQGSGLAEPASSGDRPIQLAAPPTLAAAPPDDPGALVLLASRVPLPRLDYTTAAGETRYVAVQDERPLLLNLWASWCQPCLVELAEFTARREELRQAGLDLLALSADEFSVSGQAGTSSAAAAQLERLEFPFASGQATAGLLDKLRIADHQLFDRQTPLPLPCSLLIAGDGQLAAIYKGPVSVDRVLDDVAKLALDEDQTRMASLRFPGRWLIGGARISLVPMFYELLGQGYADDAIELLTRHADRFPKEIATAEPLLRRGMTLREQGDLATAATRFRQATVLEPDNAEAHFQLGRVLDDQQQSSQAADEYAAVLRMDPDHAAAHFSLALNRKAAGETAVAAEHLREVLRLRPDHVASLYHLARILATDRQDDRRDAAEALRLAEQAVQITQGQKPEVLGVLAAAHAESGDFGQAVAVAEQALQVARARNDMVVAQQLEPQLKAYQQGQAWRE